MTKIKQISGLEILDSRGNPTVSAEIILENGIKASASVPSGASTGKHEACELRDKDSARFGGKGVQKAVDNIERIIGPKLVGKEINNQTEVDKFLIEMDGTENKSRLGANSILAVSLAICRASAASLSIPLYRYLNQLLAIKNVSLKLPTPMFNIINGGKHGEGLDFQEFHIIPATFFPYQEALRIGVEIYQTLKQILIYRGASSSVGDEGGFTPHLFTNLEAIKFITEAIKQSRHKLGINVFLGLDLAASVFAKDGGYLIKDQAKPFLSDEFINFLVDLQKTYNILVIEDPLEEDDWGSWKMLNSMLQKKALVVGDDLVTTNAARVKRAIEEQACSAIIVKPNQIGTLTETLEVIRLAKEAGLKIIVSHRSGETVDTFIADLAVGVAADYVKFGAPARGERIAKYNRLLKIQTEIKNETGSFNHP